MAGLVELTGSDAQASHEEQDDAEDGEDAGGSNRTWSPAVTGGAVWKAFTQRGGSKDRQREKSTLESVQHLLLCASTS